MAEHIRWTPLMRLGTALLKALLSAGMPMGSLMLLSVRGRTSGKLYTTPVALVQQGTQQWLVAAFGEVNWVRNLRVAGQARLIRGRRIDAIGVVELQMCEAAPILQQFLQRYQWVSFIRPYFSVPPRAPLTLFAQEAGRHPVFRIVPANR